MTAVITAIEIVGADVPLCVDLDGTLLRTDLLWEYSVALVQQSPKRAIELPFRLLSNRAACKRFLVKNVELDVSTLPYNRDVWEWLLEEKSSGRTLVLTTASDQIIAEAVAKHVGLFDHVFGSNGETNNKANNKLVNIQGKLGMVYDYAGNSEADLPLWRCSRQAIVVNPSVRLEASARRMSNVTRVFPRSHNFASTIIRELRPHQWSKNLLVYLPIIASHKITTKSVLWHSSEAVLAFCCCASAAYVLNDLLDLDADRHHPTKQTRPFASGDLPLSSAIFLLPALLVLAVGIVGTLSWRGAAVITCYFGLTVAYSTLLKRIAVLDVFVLAALYMLRIVTGGLVTGTRISEWLLSFSFLAFLSLGFCKRAAELERRAQADNPVQARTKKDRRPYIQQDLQQLFINGNVCGLISALILALYIHSEDVHTLYRQPMVLWALFPMALFWFARLWFLTRRNQMSEDPVLFALKDRTTLSLLAAAMFILFAAS